MAEQEGKGGEEIGKGRTIRWKELSPGQQDRVRDIVLSAAKEHKITYGELPSVLRPYVDEVREILSPKGFVKLLVSPSKRYSANIGKRRKLLPEMGKEMQMRNIYLLRALQEATTPEQARRPGEARIVQGASLQYNPSLRSIFERVKKNGFTHMHVDRRGDLVFTRNPKFAGKIMAPSLRKPHTLLRRYKVPF